MSEVDNGTWEGRGWERVDGDESGGNIQISEVTEEDSTCIWQEVGGDGRKQVVKGGRPTRE